MINCCEVVFPATSACAHVDSVTILQLAMRMGCLAISACACVDSVMILQSCLFTFYRIATIVASNIHSYTICSSRG